MGAPRSTDSFLDAHPSFQHPQNNLGHTGGAGRDQPFKRSLGTSFLAQKPAESLPAHWLAPASTQNSPKESLSARPPLSHLGFEEQTGQLQKDPPPTQLDSDKLELKHMMLQLLEAIAKLHQAVHSLGAELAKQTTTASETTTTTRTTTITTTMTTQQTTTTTTTTTTIPTTITPTTTTKTVESRA